jgi:large subunit ribosomal protein L18
MAVNKRERRARVKRGIRKKIFGTAGRPRLSVFRSNRHIYAQLIDDVAGRTLASSSSMGLESGSPKEQGAEVGKTLAERAKEAGIESAVFDRNGFRYHGRVQAVAEGAREGGLKL